MASNDRVNGNDEEEEEEVAMMNVLFGLCVTSTSITSKECSRHTGEETVKLGTRERMK